jgi:hypothetical protein
MGGAYIFLLESCVARIPHITNRAFFTTYYLVVSLDFTCPSLLCLHSCTTRLSTCLCHFHKGLNGATTDLSSHQRAAASSMYQPKTAERILLRKKHRTRMQISGVRVVSRSKASSIIACWLSDRPLDTLLRSFPENVLASTDDLLIGVFG